MSNAAGVIVRVDINLFKGGGGGKDGERKRRRCWKRDIESQLWGGITYHMHVCRPEQG